MTGAAFRELKVSCVVEASHEMFLNCHKGKVREAKITLFVSGAIFSWQAQSVPFGGCFDCIRF